ncbi:MAG: hypothetical protein RIS64_2838 [Bacteroidota bacterium]|jgi:hypothetical protein
MLAPNRLPDKLRAKINKANTYLFLGFQFDRWYAQLLFKLLDDSSGADTIIAPNAPLSDPQTHQFVIHQFDIKFVGDQVDFLGALYQRCADRQLLRALQAEPSALSLRIEKHIENGELAEALTLLATAAQHSEWEKDVILLQGRYAHLENSKPQTDSRDYRTEKAQILNSIKKEKLEFEGTLQNAKGILKGTNNCLPAAMKQEIQEMKVKYPADSVLQTKIQFIENQSIMKKCPQ